MIRSRRLQVGVEPVDITKGSKGSAVSIQYLRNRGTTVLFLGEPGDDEALPLEPGETLPTMQLGSADNLFLWRSRDELQTTDAEMDAEPVDVVLGWA